MSQQQGGQEVSRESENKHPDSTFRRKRLERMHGDPGGPSCTRSLSHRNKNKEQEDPIRQKDRPNLKRCKMNSEFIRCQHSLQDVSRGCKIKAEVVR